MKDIGYVIYVYLVDFIKLWIFLWGIMNFQPIKRKNLYILVGIIQSIILIISGLCYNINNDIFTVLLIIMVTVSVCFLLEGNYIKKFAYSLLAYVLLLLLDACIVGVINLSDHEFFNDENLRIILNSGDLFVLSIIVFIKKNRKKNSLQISISKRIYALLFAGAGTGLLILAALMVRSNSEATESARRAMVIVTIIVVISYNVAGLMMIIITESRDNYKALSLINQSIIESQQQYYMLVHEKQQEMRSIRHEMKNHFACIRGLYKANKFSEMEQYINQLIETSDLSSDLFETGNDIVNAILNDVQSRYRKNNIEIRLEGGFPEDLKVAPMDLCVIFANTVSNAVEAILKIERETDSIYYIDIKISSFKEDLYIDVKNPVGSKVDIHEGKIITTKKDKSIHGFGVKNLVQRVKKYDGMVNFISEDHQFYVEINMKNRVSF